MASPFLEIMESSVQLCFVQEVSEVLKKWQSLSVRAQTKQCPFSTKNISKQSLIIKTILDT
jgi:hypothetical protein